METLSDKIVYTCGSKYINVKNVKEFIGSLPFFLTLDEKRIKMLIKLVGDKLK